MTAPDHKNIYPGIRHKDSGLDTPSAEALPRAPARVMRGLMVLVVAATAGYLAVATPTVADKPAAEAKPEQQAEGEAPAAPGGEQKAMPISVAVVEQVDITKYNEFSGRLTAAEDVQVRPRVSGTIDAVHFKEGDLVEKGETLFTIDLRPFQAAYNTADAAVAAAKASTSLAERDLQRAKSLLAERALSQREFDERKSAYDNAVATLKAAEAQKELYALDLEFAHVRAPVAGRVGRPEITVGNNVRANQDIITTLQSVNPVYVDFDVDEMTYLGLMKSVRIEDRASAMPVAMALADESEFVREGRIRSFDNQLLASAGTMRVRAEFDNADGLLTPGLFARVRLGTPEKMATIVINDAAISTDQSKRFVYVVDENGTVQYREIIQGDMHPEGRIIRSGLKEGEKIIVNGLMRARPGMQVSPVLVDMKTLKPADAASPAMAAPPADPAAEPVAVPVIEEPAE